MVGSVYERAPYYRAAVGAHGSCQHIGPLGMRALVVARSRLSFAVGFHEESPEVGDKSVYLLRFLFPPVYYPFVLRVGRFGIAERHRCCEVDRQVYAYAVRPQNVGDDLHLAQVDGRKDAWRGVYIVQYAPVDAYRRIGACILGYQPFVEVEPFEDALPGIATLYGAVEVVPVVQQAEAAGGVIVFSVERVARCRRPQSVVGSIEQSGRFMGRDDD